MNANPVAPRRALPRRRVLATALVLALVVAAAIPSRDRSPGSPDADSGFAHVTVVGLASAADAPAPTKAPAAPPPKEPPAPAAIPAPAKSGATVDAAAADPSAKDAASQQETRAAEITIDEKGIRIEKSTDAGKRSRHIIVRGTDTDEEHESFDAFVQKQPWIVAVIFLGVALFFLVPVALIALVIWYKMRRTRMLNETLVKLAEKGIVPPAEALQAVGGSAAVAALSSLPPTTPLYEQAKAVRKRAAWSDLRKGVLMGGFGLGLVLYSLIAHGSANGFGLVLLFVGAGYVLLWFFEDRQGRASPGHGTPGGA